MSDYYAGVNFTKKIHSDTYPYISSIAAPTSYNGKVIFITGASRGIGRAAALSYARSGAGGLALAARTSSALASLETEINSISPCTKTLKLVVDVTDAAAVDAAVKHLWTEFERLDVVINNAGFYEPMANISASSFDCWWKSMTVNLKGPYLITRACLPYLTQSQPGGQIVNVSSVGAHRLIKGISAYSTAKFALLRFTEFTQAEYNDKGVIAIAVHPGAVATEMGLQNPKSIHHKLAGDTISWLTRERREWLGGRYLSVTWDMEEVERRKAEIGKGAALKMRMVIDENFCNP
ncbi:hypothetical protein ACEPPN_013208 [Leptodophora sp. 'Broadleaf-Isolate-01']